jgi:hypothetical protein
MERQLLHIQSALVSRIASGRAAYASTLHRCDGDGGHESSCSEALRGRPNRVVAMCDEAPLQSIACAWYFARHRRLAGPSRRGILMPCSTRTRPER